MTSLLNAIWVIVCSVLDNLTFCLPIQVADNLLHDATSNLETLIFCSQTLRSKVNFIHLRISTLLNATNM